MGYVDGLGLHEAFGGNPGNVYDPLGTKKWVSLQDLLNELKAAKGSIKEILDRYTKNMAERLNPNKSEGQKAFEGHKKAAEDFCRQLAKPEVSNLGTLWELERLLECSLSFEEFMLWVIYIKEMKDWCKRHMKNGYWQGAGQNFGGEYEGIFHPNGHEPFPEDKAAEIPAPNPVIIIPVPVPIPIPVLPMPTFPPRMIGPPFGKPEQVLY